jgi:hypothetical protein
MHSLANMDTTTTRSTHRGVKIAVVTVVVLLLWAATAIGDLLVASDESEEIVVVASETQETTQSVAMKIDIEEDETIDLDVAHADVVVDTWDGDDVLVVVEKQSSLTSNQPLNITVTRHGNSVQIATVDINGRPFRDPSLSLRILVPAALAANRVSPEVSSAYDLSKLTSVVFKALHRVAIQWITS